MSVLLTPPPLPRDAASQLLSDEVDGWRKTGSPDAVGFLTRNPDLAADRSVVVRLGYEEYCLRENAGEFDREACDLAAFVARFPAHHDALLRMLDLHRNVEANADLIAELSASAREPVWPESGQTCLGFDLIRELGRGSFARVFLAQERAAGNRTVALKVSRRGSAEARTLGRLRHANIVHVNSVAEDDATGFVAVCMEFVGGASLEDALHWAFAQGTPRNAAVFVAEATPGTGLAESPYAEGCVRLAIQIADALAHVHRAGIVHGDLKPANVTLRANGQPVLIDFNLAFDARAGDGCAGGTLAYMAPELLLAAVPPDVGVPPDAIRADAIRAVAAPADVFALGVILHELLTGRHPFGAPRRGPGADLRARLLQAQLSGFRGMSRPVPGVDAALARLVAACLAVRPEDRPTASAVAEELRRYLSWERRVTRRLRYPRALAGAAAAVVLLACATRWVGPMAPAPNLRPGPQAERDSKADERHFDRILAERPNDPDALMGRADARLRNDNVPGAIDDLKRAAEHTDDPRVKALLGYCYSCGNGHEWANHAYREALKGKFSNAALHNNLGYGYLQRASLVEAGEHLALAVEMDPQLGAAWHNRAMLELRLAFRDAARVPADGVRYAREAIRCGVPTADLYRDAAVLCALTSERSTDPRAKAEYRSDSLSYYEKAIDHGLDGPMRRESHLMRVFDGDPQFLRLLDAKLPDKRPRFAVRLLHPLDRH